MPPDRLLAELVRIAAAIGLEVRAIGLRGKYAGAGGLCTLRGRAVVILNERTSTIDRSTVLADSLAGRDLSQVDMPHLVRGFIAARTRTRSRLLLPERRPGPGLATCRRGTSRE
ncbi:MAG TPA: hypothetical protein VIM73_09135 [Polyangiaceae bacterium]